MHVATQQGVSTVVNKQTVSCKLQLQHTLAPLACTRAAQRHVATQQYSKMSTQMCTDSILQAPAAAAAHLAPPGMYSCSAGWQLPCLPSRTKSCSPAPTSFSRMLSSALLV
jgi:hypothetical protein